MKKILYALICFQTFYFNQGLFAQENGEEAPRQEQALWQSLFMIGIAVICFYFIVWRPNQKQRKHLEEQRNSLKKGDRVVAMGILGTVIRLQDQTVIVKMYDGSKLEFLKGAISEIIPGTEEDAKKVDKEEK